MVLHNLCFGRWNIVIARGGMLWLQRSIEVPALKPYLFLTNYWLPECCNKIGSSFVAVALGFFADKIGEDHDNWFINMVQAKAYQDTMQNSQSPVVLMKAVYVQYEAPIRAVGAWLIWIGIMITYSIWGLEWPFVQAQYFAISTLSTGGQ